MSEKTTTILAIESSCDETACAVVQKKHDQEFATVIAETTATSLIKHIETKGIVPEVAAREQVKVIIPVISNTIEKTQEKLQCTTKQLVNEIDAIAVTTGPGLIGSLLVGVEASRALASTWKKPLIPVNHVLAHQYANFVLTNNSQLTTHKFPALSWVISGGHTDLFLINSHQDIIKIGEKIDDSAGECFDKCARVLGHNYPGGPNIEKLASLSSLSQPTTHNSQLISLPRPLLHSKDFDTSFSGLKTAFSRKYKELAEMKQFSDQELAVLLSHELQQAIVDIIVKKTELALKKFPKIKTVLLSGGVAANKSLSSRLQQISQNHQISFHSPPLHWCTDNAVMIGAYALFHPELAIQWKDVGVKL